MKKILIMAALVAAALTGCGGRDNTPKTLPLPEKDTVSQEALVDSLLVLLYRNPIDESVESIRRTIGYESLLSIDRAKKCAIDSLMNLRRDLLLVQSAESANSDSVLSLTGGLRRSNIRQVISHNLCDVYKKRLRDKPDLAGTIAVKFAADGFGKVIFIRVVKSTVNDTTFENTVVNRIKGCVFEGSGTEYDVTEVIYLFVFPPVSTFTDKRDGRVYKIVKIGGQTWFAENLNYAAAGSVCYKNNADNCAEYGRLYNWETAKKVCPAGFHLPDDEEWTALTDYAGGASTAGEKLKSTRGWSSCKGIPYGTNDYGFLALPGGDGYGDGIFYNAGIIGNWWSATDGAYGGAYFIRDWDMQKNSELARRFDKSKVYLFSVRCVAD
jgi:uncharacterized protein (TIGR02145 family)